MVGDQLILLSKFFYGGPLVLVMKLKYARTVYTAQIPAISLNVTRLRGRLRLQCHMMSVMSRDDSDR